MIQTFQNFREEWELRAKSFNKKLEIVSDNKIFDGEFINNLIYTYLPTELPFNAHTRPEAKYQDYNSFWETHSEQRGLLMAVDPNFNSDWGLTKRLNELYYIPSPLKLHSHMPDNDAYHIAWEQQVLLGIKSGYPRRLNKLDLFVVVISWLAVFMLVFGLPKIALLIMFMPLGIYMIQRGRRLLPAIVRSIQT